MKIVVCNIWSAIYIGCMTSAIYIHMISVAVMNILCVQLLAGSAEISSFDHNHVLQEIPY